MKEKHLKIMAGVFAFLLILYFVTKPRHAGVDIDELVQTIVIGVAQDDVGQIEIYRESAGEKVAQMIFRKEGENWRIPTYLYARAQNSTVERILSDILEMTGQVRSSDPGHFETYQIRDDQGVHLLIKDKTDKPLASLIIGKRADDYQSGFVRFADKEKVYAVDKNLLSSFRIYGEIDTLSRFNQKGFVDLLAVDKQKDDLSMIVMGSNGREMVLRKVEREVAETGSDTVTAIRTVREWVLVRGNKESALDQDAVDKMFRDVCQIRAQELADRIESPFGDPDKTRRYGLDRSRHYLVFRTESGEQQEVLFGREFEKDKGYYMNVRYDYNLIYKVSKSNFDKIWKWMDDLPGKIKKG